VIIINKIILLILQLIIIINKMKNLLFTVFLMTSLLLYSQENDIKPFSVKVVVDNDQMKVCENHWKYDTIFLEKTNEYVHLQVWCTRGSDNFRWLSQEMKLHKSENPGTERAFFSISEPGRDSSYPTIMYNTGQKVLYYDNYQTGDVLGYDSNGKLYFTYQIKDGYLHGQFEVFYPTGELFSIGQYYEHAKTGLWVWFYPARKVMMEGNYLPEITMYNFKLGEKETRVNKYGKKFTFIENIDYSKFQNELPSHLQFIKLFPVVIDYRDKTWVIYNKQGEVAYKKKYKNTPQSCDWEFDQYCIIELKK